MKKILINVFQNLILILLILVLIFTLYSKYILKTNLIKINGIAFFVVLTGSMEPEIEAGEMIIIKEYDSYKVGDIVTYSDDDFFITHRIIQISNENIITKGDNNNIEDHDIILSQIQGKVIFHSKILGFFILYLLKPITILYILICLFKDSFVKLYEINLKDKILKKAKNTNENRKNDKKKVDNKEKDNNKKNLNKKENINKQEKISSEININKNGKRSKKKKSNNNKNITKVENFNKKEKEISE